MTDQERPELEEAPELQEAFARQAGQEVASTEAPEPPEETETQPPSEDPTPQEPSGTQPGYERLQRLVEKDPEILDRIRAWESGEAVLVPRQYVETLQQPRSQEPEPEAPGFYDDPEGYVKRLEERYQALEQTVTTERQAQVQQELARNHTLYQSFAQDFRSKHPDLDEDKWTELENEVTLSGRVLRGVQQHGDKAKALRDAFEREYRALHPGPSQEDMLKAQRQKRRAGGAASSPRPAQRNASAEAPKTKQERLQQGVEFLKEVQEANT